MRRHSRGAALVRDFSDLALFLAARVWPQISLNRRLPRTTQRMVCLPVCAKRNDRTEAPRGNVSTRVRLLARHADEPFRNGTMGKTSRAVISGSRLFNTVFGLPRNGENIARSLGTFESGSPAGPPEFAHTPIRRYELLLDSPSPS
jgi:hypothetical protein